ncbi:GSCFA domain-containing protein [Flavihumibacter petaseus]|uniref:GSCFA domain-containing protein n=1 Tax=Flavihumibacter petaseus NBRC 106054 TaxID=1220578 RepID=A0A0E9N4A4_9BACT|nr:GSCFA domain-containing protein [Flavihumibacter petaseus]GAO44486.1 hypothetical protein FPE01S_03_05230 [Flavihumibacter petaseus NBRC 106054]
MKFMTDINITSPETRIRYTDPLFLIGSCFTEHIGDKLGSLKFSILQNPHGILFDPVSVSRTLDACMENRPTSAPSLFPLNECWNSWDHHSRFSGIDRDAVLAGINHEREKAHHFLKKSRWLVITLGSSYSYRLVEENERPVANCHRAPAQWFRKHLCTIDETVAVLDNTLHRLFRFNPDLKIIFTVSPVRHLRDGVVENNRSKARLIEAVHHLVHKFNKLYYFPAYELVIDVLRDYRFYDIDLAHPNYQATTFVLDHFRNSFISPDDHPLMDQVQQVVNARKHRAFQPDTEAHRNFLRTFSDKAKLLQDNYPFLDFSEESAYFLEALQ